MTSIAIAIADVAVRQDSELEIDRCGYVYVLESECGKFIKIGRSKNPSKRLATLRRACNSSKRYWISVLQGESYQAEKIAHAQFQAARRLGEWFEIDFDEAVCRVEQLMASAPSAHAIHAARDRKKQRTDSLKNIFGCKYVEALPQKSDPSEDICQSVVDFVFQQEEKASAPDFQWTEAGFLADFDRLSLEVAQMASPMAIRNAVLIGRGLSYDQRKPMMKQYAMDWRLAHGGALPATSTTEAA